MVNQHQASQQCLFVGKFAVSSGVDGIGTRALHDIVAGEVVEFWLSFGPHFRSTAV